MAMRHSVGGMMASMEPQDPERERQRILARYAGMPDQQLVRLAEEWESLTDPARLALTQEMEHRGMRVEHEEESTHDQSAYAEEEIASENPACCGEFISIRELDSSAEAMVVQGFLESVGIKVRLVDDLNLPLHLMPLGNAWPVRLQVSKEDAERAIEILGTTFPDAPESGE
jgi:hypothetical protein